MANKKINLLNEIASIAVKSGIAPASIVYIEMDGREVTVSYYAQQNGAIVECAQRFDLVWEEEPEGGSPEEDGQASDSPEEG